MSSIDKGLTKMGVWPRRIVIGAGLILATLFFIAIILRMLIGTQIGRNFVEARLEATNISGQTIEIDGLSGDVLKAFRIGEVRVSDTEGVWLVANDIAADWSPIELLRGGLDAKTLSLANVDVSRRPILPERAADNDDGDGTGFLKSIDIEQFSLDRLAVSDAVIPSAVEVTSSGQVKYKGRAGTLKLQVLPLEGQGDRLVADVKLNRFVPLTADISLNAPAGGLFASLARLDPDQSIVATLQAGGAASEWTADIRIDVNDASFLRANAVTNGASLAFNGTATPGLHPMVVTYRDWLGDDVSFEGSISDGDHQRNVFAMVKAKNLDARSDIVMPDSGEMSGKISADARNVTDVLGELPVSLSELGIAGDVALAEAGPRFSGKVALADFSGFEQVQARSVSGPLMVSLQDGVIQATTDLNAAGVELNDGVQSYIGATPRLNLNGKYRIDDKTLDIQSATIDARHLRASAKGALNLGTSRVIELAGTLNASDPSNRSVQHPLLNANWSAKQIGSGAIGLTARGSANAFEGLPEPIAGWLREGATFDLSGTAGSGGEVSIPNIAIMSEGLQISGRVDRIDGGAISAKALATTSAFAMGSVDTSPVAIDVNLDGTLSSLNYTISAASPTASASGQAFGDPRIGLSGQYASGALTGNASILAATEKGPLSIVGAVSFDQGNWKISDFVASLPDLSATANVSGTGSDVATLVGDAEVRGLLPIEGFDGRVDVKMHLADNALQADGQIAEFKIGGAEFEGLSFSAEGTTASVRFNAATNGTVPISGLKQAAKIEVNGTAQNPLTAERTASFDLTGGLGKVDVSTLKPVMLRQTARGIEADAILGAMGGTVSMRLSDDAADRVMLNIDNVSLRQATELIGRLPMKGRLDADISLQDDGSKLSGTVAASVEDLQQLPSRMEPIGLKLNGRLQNEKLNMTLTSVDVEGLSVNVAMDAVVQTRAQPLMIRVSPSDGLSFESKIDGEISPIAALFASPEMILAGQLDMNVAGVLPISRGRLDGHVDLRNGEFEHERFGVVLREIAFASHLDSKSVTLDSFDAKGRDGGTLVGKGVLNMSDTPSSLELVADKLVVLKRSDVRATASGVLAFGYSDELIELTGDLVADSARVNLDALPRGGKPTLDVTFPDKEVVATETREKAITRLDIKVNSPGRIMFDGAGVDAEARIDAKITGSFSEPEINGTASIVRGYFSLLGKRFDLGASKISLTGDVMEAKLDIEAVRETDDLTGTINVTGTPRSPDVEFSSDPSVPDDEILSRILFGRSPSQLSALEAARLAAALAQLAGGGGTDLMGGLEDSLGLDTLDVGRNDDGEFQVTTGKYLADGVYLELRTGTTGVPGVAVEWEPLDNVQFDVETIPGEGQSVSVKWKKDFE